MSSDTGATHSDLGCPGLPNVQAPVMGVDGRNLEADTESGLYRLPLAD